MQEPQGTHDRTTASAIKGDAVAATSGSSRIRVLPGAVWTTIALAALVFVYVNPFRETEVDDDWAYALMVRHLLDTGQYRLHDWATANLPFQIYWGAVFARLGGPFHFHGGLRLSTLVLWAFALVAFYFLCREHGLGRNQAGLLTLGLFSCQLTLEMSFSFMTDIPYLSCFVIALYLYTRAWRLQRYDLMLMASIAGSATILTRQFGVVIIAGLILVWLATEERVRKFGIVVTGVALPLAAFVWQVRMGLKTPTWATRYNFYMLKQYYSHPLGLLISLLWRPAVILEYIAFFALPFTVLAVFHYLQETKAGRSLRWFLPEVIIGYIVAVLLCSRQFMSTRVLMPLLPWHFAPLVEMGHVPRLLLTALTTLAGGFAGFYFLSHYRDDWLRRSSPQRLLDYATAGVAGISLMFWIMGDEYLLPFLPYALIVLGHRCSSVLQRHKRWVAASCVAIALASAVYTRQLIAKNEALWQGGELARTVAPPAAIISSSWPWTSYYYFDDFLAAHRADIYLPSYFDWLDRRSQNADYLVSDHAATPAWNVIATIAYRPFPFTVRNVYVLKRQHPSF